MNKKLKILLIVLAAAIVSVGAVKLVRFIRCDTFENAGKKDGDGHWRVVWSDEFDGPELNKSNWSYQVGKGLWGNDELEYYTNGDNLSIEDGCLVITAKYDPDSSLKKYTSSRINTNNKVLFRYGRIEARIRLPEGDGVWPAFWMFGTAENGKWPYNGEIDIMEACDACDEENCFVHWGKYARGSAPKGERLDDWEGITVPLPHSDGWHLYAIEWNVRGIEFFLDDEPIYSFRFVAGNERQAVFHKPFYIILNLAVGGTFPSEPDNAVFPQSMYVDYVRAYTWEQTGESNVG